MIRNFLNELLTRKWPNFKVAHHAVLPVTPPLYAPLATPLPEIMQKTLTQMGISRLYLHQASAIEQIRAGNHVVVATPTSSGKSLIYNLAVVESLIKNPAQHALYLFPIKALSRDQLDTLSSFLHSIHSLDPGQLFRAEIYDGDTSSYQRSKIRQSPPHILLSNPDMLHYAFLPFHTKWEGFWRHLRYVVIDEMHTYRGVFGSHVAQILRRLQRICAHHGSRPQFVFLSATIANPQQLAGLLLGVESSTIPLVDNQGAPQAKRHFIFMDTEEGAFGHPSGMAAQLIVRAAKRGLKTIAFTQSRKLTELVHMAVLRAAPALNGRVSSYRAGFLPEERRVIEQRLSSGALDAVISTSALEMGIDIGGLDLCILVGYPGTVMTTWQRGGRVGRSGQESAIVLIPQADALDHYISQHPEQFLSTQYETAVNDPSNEEILKAHLPCAASELPIQSIEVSQGPLAHEKVLRELVRQGKLLESLDGKEFFASQMRPHRHVDLRSVGESYTIFLDGPQGPPAPLGKSEGIRALKECHPGAVYLHRGEAYHVETLDLHKRIVTVFPSRVPYYTRVKTEKETEILEVLASRPVSNFVVRLGRLRVTEYILAYEKRRLPSQELLGTNALELPPQTFQTVGFWIEIEPSVARAVQTSKMHFMGGIHAMEHALISMFPLFALCDRNDIGGISIPMHPQINKGAVFIYDGYPGGIGLAARGFEIIENLLEKTKELILSCTCSDGCPACIHSPKCGSGNKPLDKEASLAVLRYLLGEWALPEPAPSHPEEREDIQPDRKTQVSPWSSRRIGFFDLETQRLAQEVGGWNNKHLMRLSVAVLHESSTDRYNVYREEDLPRLIADLKSLDLVVGFNISQFDYAVLQAYTPFDLTTLPTFDLLLEIRKQLGFRLSLDHLAQKTLGQSKTSDGIQAVEWFRQGRWDLLIEYCKMDVALTRELFSHALEKGFLVYSDKKDRLLRIPTPWNLDDLMAERLTSPHRSNSGRGHPSTRAKKPPSG